MQHHINYCRFCLARGMANDCRKGREVSFCLTTGSGVDPQVQSGQQSNTWPARRHYTIFHVLASTPSIACTFHALSTSKSGEFAATGVFKYFSYVHIFLFLNFENSYNKQLDDPLTFPCPVPMSSSPRAGSHPFAISSWLLPCTDDSPLHTAPRTIACSHLTFRYSFLPHHQV